MPRIARFPARVPPWVAWRARFVPLTSAKAPDAPRAGRVDLLARNLTQAMSRDIEGSLSPAGADSSATWAKAHRCGCHAG